MTMLDDEALPIADPYDDFAHTVAAPDPVSATRRRLPELGVFTFALVTNLWSLSTNGWGNTYYAAAVRSMTQSWSNFFFASFDPGGWITVDKPPLAYWAPALLARVVGFSSWTILIPSAVAGALAVWLLTVTVRRVWGRGAGLLAGLALATMPTAVAVSRSNNPDIYLVLGIVAAVWALERAVATGRTKWLVWTGIFVGAAFLSKLGAALIPVPALWFAYLVAAPVSWKRRVRDLVVASAAMAAVSFAWIGAVALTPLSSRPWIGGSTTGSAWNLIVGYNGLGRVTGGSGLPGGGGPGGGAPRGGLGGFPGGGFPSGGSGSGVQSFGGATGIGRLFNLGMGDQVMWLAPVAVAALIGATWLFVRRRLSRREVVSLGAFAGWGLTAFVVFSYASGIYHNYYVSLLAPAMAALVGIGGGLALRAGWRGRTLAAVGLLSTAVVEVSLMRRIDALTALRVVVPVALVAASVVAVASLRWRSHLARTAALVIGTIAALIGPAAWSVSALGHPSSGTFPDARPVSLEMNAGGVPGGGSGGPGGSGARGGAFGAGLDENTLTWLESQRTTERWIVSVSSSMSASQAIIDGHSVMASGGFSGGDPALTQSRLADLVRGGELRFVQAGGGFAGGGGGGPGGGGTRGVTNIVTSVCTAVPATNWSGTGTSSIYDCAGRADAIAAATSAASQAAGTAPTGVAPTAANSGRGAPAGQPDFAMIQACMEEKGVAFPAPGGAQGAPDAATLASLQACGLTVPTGASPPPVG
jgi:4-amino-4-deoxy-L-arabinose transferase-like glycosyltransferase